MTSSIKTPLLGSPSHREKHHIRSVSDQAIHTLARNHTQSNHGNHGKTTSQSKTASFAILTAPRAALALLIYVGVGLLCFLYVKHGFEGDKPLGLVDGLYFCAVTMTTVGYGDIVPQATSAKLFICAFVFVGFGFIGVIIGTAANYFVEKQQRLLERAFEGKHQSLTESKREFVHHKVAVSAALVLIVLAIGIVVLMFIEELSFVDSFYTVCVTVTTLGYGDRAFKTTRGRLCAVFWILASTACVAQFMLYLAEWITEERQHAIAHWVISRNLTIDDVEAADIDHDGRLSAPEFVIFKLKEIGKIEQEDVSEILREFNEKDVDRSGSITISDINAEQGS